MKLEMFHKEVKEMEKKVQEKKLENICGSDEPIWQSAAEWAYYGSKVASYACAAAPMISYIIDPPFMDNGGQLFISALASTAGYVIGKIGGLFVGGLSGAAYGAIKETLKKSPAEMYSSSLEKPTEQ